MSRFWLIIFLNFFGCLHLAAEEEFDPFISSLVNTQNFLPTNIQSISAISGEWLESETDFVVQGPDPLVLTRTYSPGYSSGRLGYHWEFNRPHSLIVKNYTSSNFKKTILRARLHHPSGVKTIHGKEEPKGHIYSLPLFCTRALTNCCSGEISGRTNLHNTSLKINENNNTCESITGSGLVTRYFLKYKNFDESMHFSPEYERKANGNLLLFKGKEIISKNADESIEYSRIKLHSKNLEMLIVNASDGKSATYIFNRCQFQHPTKVEPTIKSKRYCLIKANYSHKAQIEYEYEHPPHQDLTQPPPNPLLKKKKVGTRGFQEVTYYKEGVNAVDGLGKIKIPKSSFCKSRVKEIKAPVGQDDTPVVTHRFIYVANDTEDANRRRSFSGQTEVYDAYMNKTVYEYNKEHRPISISRYARNGKVYSKEKFVWNEGEEEFDLHDIFCKKSVLNKKESTNDNREMVTEIVNFDAYMHTKIPHQQIITKLSKHSSSPESKQIGNLIGKYLKRSDGKIEHALFFAYDSNGNIKKETFYGNLTGTCQIPIELDRHEIPQKNECEYYQKQFTYSKDAFNHLLTEKQDNGKEIEYTYDPHTQQVSAKYIKDHGNIQLRQFFFYDSQTAALIKVIKDDGSHRNSDILNDVKERVITYLILNDCPPLGLPKIIEEKYLDSNQEHLLKRVECHYDLQGHLCRQDHFDANACFCYSLFWTYDSHGNITEEINALGHKILKNYDEQDNLIRKEGPRKNDITEYEYDFANRLIQIKHISDGKCLVTAHRYDLRNNLIATTDSFGQTIEYEYDEFNRLIKTTHPSIQLTQDWIISPKEEILAYDINNRPIKIKDAGGFETSISYNARGKPTSKTHADGTCERFEYEKGGALAKSIAPNGTATVYKRDYLGRVIQEEIYDTQNDLLSLRTFTYKGSKLISKIDPEGNSTNYSYDGAGRLTSETCGKICKRYAYDSLNRISKVMQSFGDLVHDISVKAFSYDSLNQVTEERLEDAFGNTLQRIAYTYDELGNKISVKRETESGISLTQVEYQADGKPLKVIDAEGNVTHFTYDETYHNHLNQTVLKTIKTDAKGRNTSSIFDTLGRVREVNVQDAFGNLLAKQEIDYDPMGRRIKTIDSVISDGVIQRHFINAWRYHPNGQEDLIVEALGTPHQKTTSIYYNSFGQKEKVLKPNGTELNYTYDSFGRLKTLCSSDNTIAYNYTYNLNHQIKEVQDLINHHVTERHYEKEGYLKEETLGNGLHLTYSCDSMGRLTHLILPDQSSVTYLYNAAYLKEVQRHKNHQLLYQHQYTKHDHSGNLMQANLIGLAGSVHFSYDLQGRNQSTHHLHRSQHISHYDNVGRLTKKTTHNQSGLREDHFTYNNLDHLQTENGHVSNSYKTDSLHNRLQKSGRDSSINAANQLTEHANCKYRYDGNGNLREKIKDHQTTLYAYDALDRLISVSSPHGLTTYTYDAFHRRLSKTSQGITLQYLYQGQDEIGCVNPQGEITELRILGVGIEAEIGASIALELNGQIYAPIHDHAGNTVYLINSATGQTEESYLYSAFGEETILNAEGLPIARSQVGNPWRFASKRIDPETGWVYFGRRYYDLESGRWTTPDPLGFADGSNLYAYLHHNPLNAYDAYGLIGEAYRDSVEAGSNSPHYSVFSDLGRPEIQNNDQERASYINNAIAGIFHGGVNFFTNQICDCASFACLIGSHEFEDGFDERFHFQLSYSQWQSGQIDNFDNWLAGCLCNDPNSSIYQNCRSYATTGLEIGTLAIGCYGLAKGGIELVQVARLSHQGAKIGGKVAAQEAVLNQFHQAARSLNLEGKNNIRILRGWAKSKGWEKASNKGGPEIWGRNINGKFDWNLKIKPEASFRPNLESGSNIPRFDARIDIGSKYQYINPFTDQIGEKKIGTHLPLDILY